MGFVLWMIRKQVLVDLIVRPDVGGEQIGATILRRGSKGNSMSSLIGNLKMPLI